MLQTVGNYIERKQLLSKDKLYLVALSGGADSVALLRLLLALDYHVEAAHCNFHLRGDESDRDEQFVKDLCTQHNVPLHLAHFDTKAYAELHKLSIEMAARELRYRYFEQLTADIQAEAVCVAHHRDDNVETMLINLLRGTGIHGLTGIKAKRTNGSLLVIRPLLCVSRIDILSWLQQLNQPYVTDSSNLVDDVMRNKVRLNLIPILKSINPSVMENLQDTIEQLSEAEAVYNHYTTSTIASLIKGNSLVISELKNTESPLCILFEWLHPYLFQPATIRQIEQHLDVQTGRIWQSPTHELCIDRGRLLLTPRKEETKPMRIPETGVYIFNNEHKLRLTIQTNIELIRQTNTACLDADKVRFPLTLRTVQTADRFIPFGMEGSKLVSDFLTDLKLPLTLKRQQLVLTDASDSIVWVVGLRPAAPYCIGSDTKNELLITFE